LSKFWRKKLEPKRWGHEDSHFILNDPAVRSVAIRLTIASTVALASLLSLQIVGSYGGLEDWASTKGASL
jgi:hypothetical protein